MGTLQGLSRGTLVVTEFKPALFTKTLIRRLLVQGPNCYRPVRTPPLYTPPPKVNNLFQ